VATIAVIRKDRGNRVLIADFGIFNPLGTVYLLDGKKRKQCANQHDRRGRPHRAVGVRTSKHQQPLFFRNL
jgi:hypothetical protein